MKRKTVRNSATIKKKLPQYSLVFWEPRFRPRRNEQRFAINYSKIKEWARRRGEEGGGRERAGMNECEERDRGVKMCLETKSAKWPESKSTERQRVTELIACRMRRARENGRMVHLISVNRDMREKKRKKKQSCYLFSPSCDAICVCKSVWNSLTFWAGAEWRWRRPPFQRGQIGKTGEREMKLQLGLWAWQVTKDLVFRDTSVQNCPSVTSRRFLSPARGASLIPPCLLLVPASLRLLLRGDPNCETVLSNVCAQISWGIRGGLGVSDEITHRNGNRHDASSQSWSVAIRMNPYARIGSKWPGLNFK